MNISLALLDLHPKTKIRNKDVTDNFFVIFIILDKLFSLMDQSQDDKITSDDVGNLLKEVRSYSLSYTSPRQATGRTETASLI